MAAIPIENPEGFPVLPWLWEAPPTDRRADDVGDDR